MMPVPSTDRLTRAYLQHQTERTLATLNQIVDRSPVGSGRAVPSSEDLAIHDGRRLEFSQRGSWTLEEQQLLLRVLSLFFTEMIRIIQDYSGVVEKNTGDGLMAYFVKQGTDDVTPHQRGLSAALTMFSAADRLINPLLRASNIPVLDFRICLDHGPVTIAKVGAARGFNGIVAIGATANITSKMLAVADANTILIGSMMLDGLPLSWRQNFVRLKSGTTGWTFRQTGTPYFFWEYTGRWKEPTT